MHDDIQNRLLCVEDELLSAISAGGSQLEAYDNMWATLLHDIQRASLHQELPKHTMTLAHSVASHVLTVAECFATFENKYRDLTLDLHGDLKQLVTGFSDIHPETKAGSPVEDHNYSTHSSFIGPAYRWLLDNLHNPYPSVKVKKSIAQAAGCSLSVVSAWFTSVRRRMGWTVICRDYFQNCRTDAVDAAYQALVKRDPNRKLSPCHIQAFMEMKVNAECLYSSTFTPSALASALDAVVQGVSEEKKGEEGRKTGGKSLPDAPTREAGTTLASRSYPSPGYSRTTSPALSVVESPTDRTDTEDDSTSPVFTGKKRRCSSSVDLDGQDIEIERFAKRPRASSGPSSASVGNSIGLPSPCSSAVNDQLHDWQLITGPHSPTPTSSPSVPRVPFRKRHLSSSDLDRRDTSRRPYGTPIGPRAHAVSDPIPKSTRTIENSVDDWFNVNFSTCFEVPPPVEFADIDSSFPWEIELFNAYSIPREQTMQDCCVQDLCHDSSKLLDTFQSGDSLSFVGDYLFESQAPSAHLMNQETIDDSQLKDLASSISLSTDWTNLLGSDFHGETTSLDQHCGFGLDPVILQLSSLLPSGDAVSG